MPESKNNTNIWAYGPIINPQQADELKPYEQDPENSEWVKAFQPENKYFEELAEKSDNSPTQSSCISSKAYFTAGDGFNLIFGRPSIKKQDVNTEISDEEAGKIDGLIDTAASSGESLTEVIEMLAKDYYKLGNCYGLLVLSRVENTIRTYLNYRDAVWCRVSKADANGNIKMVGYSPNWCQENSNPEEFALRKYGRWPYWTGSDKSNSVLKRTGFDILSDPNIKTAYSVIHLRNKSNNKYYYGIPDSISGLIYQQVEAAIGEDNIDDIETGFQPNTLIQGVINATRQEKNDFFGAIEETFTKSGKGPKKSRIFTNLVSNKEAFLTVDKISERPKEGAFLMLSDLAAQKILTANRWHPILASVQTSGKLGNSQEIEEVVQMAQNTVIQPVQNKMVSSFISRYLKLNGIEEYGLSISHISPTSFSGKLNPGEVLTINEQRSELGYGELDDEQIIKLKEEKSNDNGNTSNKEAAD